VIFKSLVGNGLNGKLPRPSLETFSKAKASDPRTPMLHTTKFMKVPYYRSRQGKTNQYIYGSINLIYALAR